MKKIKLVLVDDHPLFLRGVEYLFKNNYSHLIDFLFSAHSGPELFEKLDKDNLPDIILLDYQLPIMDGSAIADEIKNKFSFIKIICFTMYSGLFLSSKFSKDCLNGYVIKDAPVEELILAINVVFSGSLYFPPERKSYIV